MFHFGTNHTTRTAGRLSVVPLFSLARRRRGEESERKKTGIGEDGSGTRRRMGEDFEMKEEDGEDGNGKRGGGERTLRGGKRTERMGNGLGGRRNDTLKREKQGLGTGQNKDFEEGKKGNRESCDFIAVFW